MSKFNTIRDKHLEELTTQMKVVTEQVADLTTTVDLLSKFVDLERFNRKKTVGMSNIPEDAIIELETRRDEVRARYNNSEYKELVNAMITEPELEHRTRMLRDYIRNVQARHERELKEEETYLNYLNDRFGVTDVNSPPNI